MKPDTKAYIAVMEEIKHRTNVVFALSDQRISVMYKATHVESMVLQVRMITELVALASLSANKSIFEKNRIKFEKQWHPKEILRDVENLNPNFYPVPVVEVPLEHSIVDGEFVFDREFVPLQDGYMTRDELIEVHGKCGNLLHAQNPYGKGVDYDNYKKMVPMWMNRIVALLNFHLIKLLNEDRFYRVYMRDVKDERAHMETFERVEDPNLILRYTGNVRTSTKELHDGSDTITD